MQLNWYRLRRAAVAVALLVACSEDPTASLAGDPAHLSLAFDFVEVDVDAAKTVDAVVRDASGTPVNIPVTVTSADPRVASVSTTQAPPQVLTRVIVRGDSVGTTRIIATAAGLTDTMDVRTFAARIEVINPPPGGVVVSGQSHTFTHQYLSATGRVITAQVATPTTWSVDEPGRATLANPAIGAITAKDFGAVSVTATGAGSTDSLRGSANVLVQHVPFQGTFTPGTSGNPSNPSGVITIAPGTGPAFDTDTRVFLNRAEVPAGAPNSEGDSVVSLSASAIQVFLGDLRQAGRLELILAGVGASQLSVGTGPTDSITLQLPALAGTVAPDPVDPGAVLTISAGGGPAFDSPDTRAYFDGALVSSSASAAERVVSVTPTTVTLQINDRRADNLPDTIDVRLTRVGTAQGAQAGRFVVRTPAPFTGQLSANSGIPAQVVTITRPAGAPWTFDADTRVFFDGIEALIAEPRTADAIRVAVPVIDKPGQVQLRMTRLGGGQEAQRIQFTSIKTFSDPLDPVNNDPTTAPVITANGDYFVVLHGGCVNGSATSAADCDDWFRITNSSGSPATVSLNVLWEDSDADIDLIPLDENFDCADQPIPGPPPVPGFQCRTTATLADPETGTVIIPANTTYFILLNYFAFHGQHHLTRLRVSGLP